MRSLYLGITALLFGAILIGYALRMPPPTQLVPSSVPVASSATAPKLFVETLPTPMQPPSEPRVRRLVATRLGHPRELRFERVRVVGTRRYGAVTCGNVAWSDVVGGATEFKRFIATRRNVILEGREHFDRAWALSCD